MKGLKLGIVCLFLFLLSGIVNAQYQADLIPVNYSYPKEYTIADIQVVGADNISKQTILLLSGLKAGDKVAIPGDKLTNSLKNIWKQKIVGDVQMKITKVEGDQIWLSIELKERPRISDILIEGTSKSERTDIQEFLSIRRGQVLSQSSVKNQRIRIDDFFLEKGYYNVSTTPTYSKDTVNDAQIVTFNVTKGEKVKIEDIVVTGVSQIEEKVIKRKLKNTKKVNHWRFYKRSKYFEDEFLEDKASVLALYNEKGFRDAQVDYKIESVNDKRIKLYLDIEEGNKYYFRDITWYGNHIYKDSILDNILSIKKGDVYNKSMLDTKLNFNPTGADVSSLYLDNGYLFFNVNPVEVRVDGDSIDLELRMYEGDQAVINRVYVTGNTKTSDHVIMRELWTLPGDKFSRTNLINSQRQIAQLGYFDPEQIGIFPKPNPADGTVDIEYAVVEKPSDQLQLSGGWGGGGAVSFVGTLGLMFNNFSTRNILNRNAWSPLPSGDGQRLSLQFRANGRPYQSFNFSFTEPWLGGKKPISLTLSTYYSIIRRLESDSDGGYNETGFLKNKGASIGIGSRLNWPDRYFFLQGTLGLVNYNVDNYNFGGTSLCEKCNSNSLSLQLSLSRDSRGNNPQFYTHGSSHTLSVALTPPYTLFNEDHDGQRWLEYNKWMSDNSWFIPLTGNTKSASILSGSTKNKRQLVLNARAHFGFIAPYRSSNTVGPFERFRLGGDGLTGLNGSYLYGTDVIGLRGYSDPAVLTPVGDGVAYNKFVMELRYPIVTEGVATIFVLGFAEGGNVWSGLDEFNPFNLKRSAGMGARIFMPAFGMIGVDYGYGFDSTPISATEGNNGWQFHFTIGQQIR